MNNLSKVAMQLCPGENRTFDLMITSPTLHLCVSAACVYLLGNNKVIVYRRVFFIKIEKEAFILFLFILQFNHTVASGNSGTIRQHLYPIVFYLIVCGTAVERRSLAGVLFLSCARPVADG